MLLKTLQMLGFRNYRVPAPSRPRFAPKLVSLEDRVTPATFNVTSLADTNTAGTLRFAIGQANATPTVADNIVFQVNGTVSLGTGLLIASPMTITGKGAANTQITRVGGTGAMLSFTGPAGTDNVLEDLTITGGNHSKGGAILGNGQNLIIYDSNFSNNDSTGFGPLTDGGAIYWENGTLSMSQCSFIDNGAGDGGAIFAQNTNLTIENSLFLSNTADSGSGGAIAAESSTLTVTSCDLISNSSFSHGGAIRFSDPGSKHFNLSNSTFTNNDSNDGGGAVLAGLTNGIFSIINCTIEDNSAKNVGGGIRVEGTVNMSDSTIEGNTGGSFGGGIYVDGDLSIVSSTIHNNQTTVSGSNGGGIAFTGDSLSLDRSTVSLNVSKDNGGGINFGGSTFSISNSTISGNVAGGYGGGIALFVNSTDKMYRIDNSTIAFNTSNDAGAGITRIAIAGFGASKLNLFSSIVSQNTGPNGDFYPGGGGLTHAENSLIGATAGLFSSTSKDNIFGTIANPISANLGTLTLNGGTTKTHVPMPDSPVFDKGANVLGFTLDQRGQPRSSQATDMGAVEVQALSMVVDIATDENDGNYSVGDLSLREALIRANEYPHTNDFISFGSIFHPSLPPSTITLTLGEIDINGPVEINGSSYFSTLISGNNSSRIFDMTGAPDNARIYLANMLFTKGDASTGGGAIRYDEQDLEITYCKFVDNTAPSGGAISGTSSLGFGSLNLYACTLNGNISGGGGALQALNGKINIDSTTFHNNTGSNGGAILVHGVSGTDNFRIVNSTISANTGTFSGAMDIHSAGTTVIRNTTITLNQAISNSNLAVGGIYQMPTGPNCNLTLDSTIVSGNSSPAGLMDIYSSGLVNVNHSAIGSAAGFTLTGANNLAFGTNLKLGPLFTASFGGANSTHLPAADSPVVNKGSNVDNLISDQRGQYFLRSRSGVDIGSVEAETDFIVTNANDSGPGSLRDAVAQTELFALDDTIRFEPVFFSAPRTITLTTGFISFGQDVALIGPGAHLLTISGNNDSPIFSTTPASPFLEDIQEFNLSGVTLTKAKGYALFGSEDQYFISNTAISGNSGTGFSSIVLAGTGLGSKAILNLTNTTVSGNTANAGGGIYLAGRVSVDIVGSTISGNVATGGNGGGILFVGAIGSDGFSIKNSTLSGNSSNASGAAIAFGGTASDGGTAFITNCTIAHNTGNVNAGIFRTGSVVTLDIDSSIIDENITSSFGLTDISSSGTVNLDKSAVGTTFGFTPTGSGNLIGADLKLASLRNVGGTTMVHPFPITSPLVNAGSNTKSLQYDQRGNPFSRSVNGLPDIGAFEAMTGTPPVVDELFVNDGDSQRSRVTRIDLTIFPNVEVTPAAFQVRRQSDNALVGINVNISTPGGNITAVAITFTGALSEFGSIADGRYTLTINSLLAEAQGGGYLDGNYDGFAGDNFTFEFHRLFGDFDANATVDGADLTAFGNTFSTTGIDLPADFEQNTTVDGSDLLQLGNRFGVTL